MRKIIGFAFFVISGVIIAAVLIEGWDTIVEAFSDVTFDNLLESAGLLVTTLWSILYEPMVILLLSVIAMGSYGKK